MRTRRVERSDEGQTVEEACEAAHVIYLTFTAGARTRFVNLLKSQIQLGIHVALSMASP